jgi:hypothetical protein
VSVRTAILAALIVVPTCGCDERPVVPTLDGAYDLASSRHAPALQALRAGGLSGIVFDAAGDLLAISDARTSPRILMFQVHDRPFELEPTGSVSLYNVPEVLDPEAVVRTAEGNLLVASEGVQDEEPRTAPGIFEFTREGEFVRALRVRNHFIAPLRGPLIAGVRANAGFESLTLSSDGKRLFTATEGPLVQDGEPANFDHGGRVRILEYVRGGADGFAPAREWAYEIDAVARPDFAPGFFINGLVELLALDNGDGDPGDLLAMERSYASETGDGPGTLHRIRVYRVSLRGATNVATIDSLAGRTGITPATKRLILDLGELPGRPGSLRELANFEGLAWALPAAGGRRKLWLVSDDNFSWREHTWFLRLNFVD